MGAGYLTKLESWWVNPQIMKEKTTVTNFLGLEFWDQWGKLNIPDLSTPVTIHIPKSIVKAKIHSNSPTKNAVYCSYYNTYLKGFRKDGCRFVRDLGDKIQCECDHLDSVMARYSEKYMDNKWDFKAMIEEENLPAPRDPNADGF